MAMNERGRLRIQWVEVEDHLDNGSVSIEEVRAALQGLIEKAYRVRGTPNNTKSFEAAKAAAGPWSYWNPGINEANFTMDPVDGEVELRLHHFNRLISDADATRRLDEMGLVREDRLLVILAFLGANPDLQREFPIVTAVAWTNPDGNRHVVYAHGGSQSRGLDLDWGDGVWPADCRFLVRRG